MKQLDLALVVAAAVVCAVLIVSAAPAHALDLLWWIRR